VLLFIDLYARVQYIMYMYTSMVRFRQHQTMYI